MGGSCLLNLGLLQDGVLFGKTLLAQQALFRILATLRLAHHLMEVLRLRACQIVALDVNRLAGVMTDLVHGCRNCRAAEARICVVLGIKVVRNWRPEGVFHLL